jgi:hypothetical protein
MPKEGEKEEMETGYRLIFKRLTDLKSCVLEKVLLSSNFYQNKDYHDS